MATNTRCEKCRALLGPEDRDIVAGREVQHAVCYSCRKRETARAKLEADKRAKAMAPHAIAARARKVLGMVAVIDANAREQGLDCYDQAGRILLAASTWSDATWLAIARKYNENATEPSELTRDAVKAVYRGRATRPLQNLRAS